MVRCQPLQCDPTAPLQAVLPDTASLETRRYRLCFSRSFPSLLMRHRVPNLSCKRVNAEVLRSHRPAWHAPIMTEVRWWRIRWTTDSTGESRAATKSLFLGGATSGRLIEVSVLDLAINEYQQVPTDSEAEVRRRRQSGAHTCRMPIVCRNSWYRLDPYKRCSVHDSDLHTLRWESLPCQKALGVRLHMPQIRLRSCSSSPGTGWDHRLVRTSSKAYRRTRTRRSQALRLESTHQRMRMPSRAV